MVIVYNGANRFKLFTRYRIDFPDAEALEQAKSELQKLRSGPWPSPYVRTVLPDTFSIVVDTQARGSKEALFDVALRHGGNVEWARGIAVPLR